MQKEIDRLINSYRSNALSKEEAGMLAGWLEESDENRAYFRECLARRELPASAKAEREWARFAARNKILFAVPEVAGRRRSRFLRYVAAAAVVAAGVCAVWFWQRTPDVASEAGAGAEISAAQPLEYRTACGERLDIVLPDGSKVCMNSEATLTVDPGFGKATREIEFDGEAFFTISPDKNCPFIIHSANNNYTVLGTSFNLQSYARENFAVVTLHTGCLQAQARKDVIILDPSTRRSSSGSPRRPYRSFWRSSSPNARTGKPHTTHPPNQAARDPLQPDFLPRGPLFRTFAGIGRSFNL